jgi:cytochrome c oxidase subunit 2
MRFAKTTAGVLAAVASSACAAEYPQSSIAPATDFAHVIHEIYVSIFWWTMLILVVVWVVLAYILIRFRERPDSPEPRQTHGHMGLEIAWTIGPALIVVAIAIPTIRATFATQRGDPEGAMVVDVIGHQYWWEFRYPDLGVVTANELHLPVDRPISLRLHSADVIHSFWVPQLGGKRDVNPLVATPDGVDPRYTWIHFTAQETGAFLGQCAEFCGESHSLMGVRVLVESEDDFESWVEDWRGSGDSGQEPAVDPLVEQGREVFHGQTCIACHAVQGTNAAGVLGPDLTLMGRRWAIGAGRMENTQENLERWIREPHLIKPGVLMPGVDRDSPQPQFWPATNLDDNQVRAIAAYLLSLR